MSTQELCRFYSPDWLGGIVSNALFGREPQSIIDLGCGEGALSHAAAKRWSDAALLTVDLDREVSRARTTNPYATTLQALASDRHVIADISRRQLHSLIGAAPASFDLALSNPPYASVPWRREFGTILKRAKLDGVLAQGRSAPLVVIFLAQALYMLNTGGTLGFVAPDSLISGAAFKPLRKRLLEICSVERVIQLPRRAFKRTDAQTFVICLRKEPPKSRVRLERVKRDGGWSDPIELDVMAGIERLDHSYHSEATSLSSGESILALGASITRGRATSRQVAASNGKIFHTTSFPRQVGEGVSFDNPPFPEAGPESVYAQPGDILIARVDRKLERKIARVVEGHTQISDCVLRIRCNPLFAARTLSGLVSPQGQAALIRASRGTGARHLSARSLGDILV